MKRSACAGALLALASACQFSYDNRAEKLNGGEVRGRTMAEKAGGANAFEPSPYARVGLRGAPYAVRSRSSGLFALLDLPVGRTEVWLTHRDGTRKVRRTVDVQLGSDGQPEGVLLGEVAVLRTARVTGTLRLTATDGTPQPAAWSSVVDTEWGLQAFSGADGAFTLHGAPVGPHRLVAYSTDGTALISDPLEFTVTEADQGLTKPIGEIALRPVAATEPGHLFFSLEFATAATQLPPSELLKVQLLDRATYSWLPATYTLSSALTFDEDLPEGIYDISVCAATSLPGECVRTVEHELVSFALPALPGVAVFHGSDTDAGALFGQDPRTVEAAENACDESSDCLPGMVCDAASRRCVASEAGITAPCGGALVASGLNGEYCTFDCPATPYHLSCNSGPHGNQCYCMDDSGAQPEETLDVLSGVSPCALSIDDPQLAQTWWRCGFPERPSYLEGCDRGVALAESGTSMECDVTDLNPDCTGRTMHCLQDPTAEGAFTCTCSGPNDPARTVSETSSGLCYSTYEAARAWQRCFGLQ